MFLSRLFLNLRDRQVRCDLTDSYEMHRTLLRAFPGQPDGGPGRVLFRLDHDPDTGAATVLVQSEKAPEWSALPDGYLAEPAACKPFEPVFAAGQRLQFRLRANPTHKTGTTSKKDRLDGRPKSNGRRVGLLDERVQADWLARKGQAGGFRLLDLTAARECPSADGFAHARKPGYALTFLAVRFDGLLAVADPELFLRTLREGIGPAKGLGFGLLSVARPGR